MKIKFIIPGISIHALRVEGDYNGPFSYGATLISIHALRVEGDLCLAFALTSQILFLSTPSGWRATAITTR